MISVNPQAIFRMEKQINSDRIQPDKAKPMVDYQTAVESRLTQIERLLQKIKKNFDEDDIHNFRVEVKKLKAVLRLYQLFSADPSIYKFPKNLNKGYKDLGGLREWQIQHEKVCSVCRQAKINKPIKYLDKIHQKTTNCKQKARSSLAKISFLGKNKKRLKLKFPDLQVSDAKERFIHSNLLAVKNLFDQGVQDDDSMHEMRKLLKDIQYILSLTEEKKVRNGVASSFNDIRTVNRKLGDFHDLRVAVQLIDRELRVPHKTQEENKILRAINKQWRKEKEKLKGEALTSCKNLVYAQNA